MAQSALPKAGPVIYLEELAPRAGGCRCSVSACGMELNELRARRAKGISVSSALPAPAFWAEMLGREPPKSNSWKEGEICKHFSTQDDRDYL